MRNAWFAGWFMSSFDATPDANLAVSVDNRSILVKYTWYGDADLNGIVDERDLAMFSTAYANHGGPLSPGAVPEPAALMLIGLGLAALAGRRNRESDAA